MSLKWKPTPEWQEEACKLLLNSNIVKPSEQTVDQIEENTSNFIVKFPVETTKCSFLKTHVARNILNRNINSVYPIVHHKALELFCKFILYKRKYGTKIEKSLYKDMSLKDFIDRLLKKRAVAFVGVQDSYHLLTNEEGMGNWENIGKTSQKPPLVLEDCLSYDEIKCSAFLCVSSYTYFLNTGDRKNMAVFDEDRNKIEDEGIIIGLIGPRLIKYNVMEYQDIVISEKQNTSAHGYGSKQHSIPSLFAEFYDDNFLKYKEAIKLKDTKRFTKLFDKIFDNHIYCKRLTISFDTLLMEANYRAKMAKKSAYLHVVGLGLGVWKMSAHQENFYMDTFADRIELLSSSLHNISDICFSYINSPNCGNWKNGDFFPIKDHVSEGIKIHIYNRQPHERVSKEGDEKLLVVSYAWDANSLPGNEWWWGSLSSSSDPAAASSTQVAELHNPHINYNVTADNLMVVTEDDVVTFEKYQEIVRCNSSKRQSYLPDEKTVQSTFSCLKIT